MKVQLRLILIAACILVLVIPVVSREPFYSVIQTRIETFTRVANDGSGRERQETYRALMDDSIRSVIGNGLGGDIAVDAPLDSSILYMILQMGWLGTIPYFGSMIILVFQSFSRNKVSKDPFLISCRSIVVGSILIFPLGPVILGVTGVAIWMFLAMSLAGEKYYSYTQFNIQYDSTFSLRE